MSKEKEKASDERIKESIAILVELGADVNINKNLLYRLGDSAYTILKFDMKSNLRPDPEENFKDLNKAIERFIELSGGKL